MIHISVESLHYIPECNAYNLMTILDISHLLQTIVIVPVSPSMTTTAIDVITASAMIITAFVGEYGVCVDGTDSVVRRKGGYTF